jgi:hypothetical protein
MKQINQIFNYIRKSKANHLKKYLMAEAIQCTSELKQSLIFNYRFIRRVIAETLPETDDSKRPYNNQAAMKAAMENLTITLACFCLLLYMSYKCYAEWKTDGFTIIYTRYIFIFSLIFIPIMCFVIGVYRGKYLHYNTMILITGVYILTLTVFTYIIAKTTSSFSYDEVFIDNFIVRMTQTFTSYDRIHILIVERYDHDWRLYRDDLGKLVHLNMHLSMKELISYCDEIETARKAEIAKGLKYNEENIIGVIRKTLYNTITDTSNWIRPVSFKVISHPLTLQIFIGSYSILMLDHSITMLTDNLGSIINNIGIRYLDFIFPYREH